METAINLVLITILAAGIAGVFYIFYKLLAGGLKAMLKNDD